MLFFSIQDEYKIEKFISFLEYIKILHNVVSFHISFEGIYIQILNENHVMLCELNIPSYWFHAFEFPFEKNIIITLHIHSFHAKIYEQFPEHLFFYYSIDCPNSLLIYNSPYMYDNVPNTDIFCYSDTSMVEPLLNIPNNNYFPYFVIIEQSLFINILHDLKQQGITEIQFYCSNEFQHVVLYANKQIITLLNQNELCDCDDFELSFQIEFFEQLPLLYIENAFVQLYLCNNTPLKCSFLFQENDYPLDESDNYIFLNVFISPNECINEKNEDITQICNNLKMTEL